VGVKAEANSNILAICCGSIGVGKACGIGRTSDVGLGKKQLGSERRR
jgi:hypothetical protein